MATFSLLFMAGGTAVVWFSVHNYIECTAAQGWVAVPAKVVAAELVRERKGGTHLECAYEYEYAGRRHTSERTHVSTCAPNEIEPMYQRLKAAMETHRPVTCYVDPERPERAALHRTWRPTVGIGVGLVGLGLATLGAGVLLYGAFSIRKALRRERVRREHPGEPWRRRSDWARGVVRLDMFAEPWLIPALCLVAGWNVFSVGSALAAWPMCVWVSAPFLLIGVGLIGAVGFLVYYGLRHSRSRVELDEMPLRPGGVLKGTLVLDGRGRVPTHVRVRVSCRGFRAGRRHAPRTFWQYWRVLEPGTKGDPQRGVVRLGLPIPPMVPSREKYVGVEWRLEVRDAQRRLGLWLDFVLPVYPETQLELHPVPGIPERASS